MPQHSIISRFFYLAALLMPLAGCYRFPTDQDYSVIPTTNNPEITGDKRMPPLPGVKY